MPQTSSNIKGEDAISPLVGKHGFKKNVKIYTDNENIASDTRKASVFHFSEFFLAGDRKSWQRRLLNMNIVLCEIICCCLLLINIFDLFFSPIVLLNYYHCHCIRKARNSTDCSIPIESIIQHPYNCLLWLCKFSLEHILNHAEVYFSI